MIYSAHGLPTYPRNYLREVAPVLAVEPEPYDPYPEWMTGKQVEVEHYPDDWDFLGGNVKQVLLAQVFSPRGHDIAIPVGSMGNSRPNAL
jgi:hypothetical protein